ncbi:MAG: carbonate dehydratase [Acidobacteria bacterium]|nr:MAG: carbonate dehydratase [Acidobacteriota bacterium]
MNEIETVLNKNREWSRSIREKEPDFFQRLARQQAPAFLWIGCSDSRVPANQIAGMMPGELFVHRNVANIVYPSDLNCLSVIEYAVDVLRVRHIIVCGHYGCGGVRAALDNQVHGLIDNWLTRIRDIYVRHAEEVDSLDSEKKRVDRMCELNVIEQVKTVTHTTIIQDAWARGQQVSVHAWVYGLDNGLVNDLGVHIDSPSQVSPPFRFARATNGRLEEAK